MSCVINASTTTGLVESADLSGTLELQSNGTTKLSVLSTGVSGTLIQGTAVASTSGTSIDFTGIPSWVKRITVMFSGVSVSGTSNPIIQVGSGSITITGYGSSSARLAAATLATTGATSGFVINTANAAVFVSGQMVITNISGNIWVASHSLSDGSQAYAGGGTSPTLSGTLDRIRITTVNGTDTFDAGSINIQYEG